MRAVLPALVAAVLFVSAPSAQAHVIYLGKDAQATQARTCAGHVFKVRDYRTFARRTYAGSGKISKSARARSHVLHVCQRNFRARKAVGRLHTQLYREWKGRRRYAREWAYWSRLWIPTCTWQGESGFGPQFASWRYNLRNGGSHGPPIDGVAHGKYQMKPSTYHSVAKYGDWSELDQEIAGHRLYWNQGTAPWEAC